jgi:hypothetical protein
MMDSEKLSAILSTIHKNDIYKKSIIVIFTQERYDNGRRDEAVGIATGCLLNGRGMEVRVPVGTRFLSPPGRPDRFWAPNK